MITTPMDLQKLIWPQLDMEKSDSIQISMPAEKFVLVYWELGEALHLKTGIQRSQLFFKYSFQFKPLLWVKKFISMSLALKTSKELKKERKRTKPIQI